MRDLIKALKIFLKYGDPGWPTACKHEKLIVYINPKLVSKTDLKKLNNLGFFPSRDPEDENFYSFRFGSC